MKKTTRPPGKTPDVFLFSARRRQPMCRALQPPVCLSFPAHKPSQEKRVRGSDQRGHASLKTSPDVCADCTFRSGNQSRKALEPLTDRSHSLLSAVIERFHLFSRFTPQRRLSSRKFRGLRLSHTCLIALDSACSRDMSRKNGFCHPVRSWWERMDLFGFSHKERRILVPLTDRSRRLQLPSAVRRNQAVHPPVLHCS